MGIKHICQLCFSEKKKEKVHLYIGGFVNYSHKSCLEIATQGIKLYEQYVLFHYKLLPEYQKKKRTTKEHKR